MVRRVHTEVGLNYVTDTLTSAWDAMRANFGVSPAAAAPHGWVAPPPRSSGRLPQRKYRWEEEQILSSKVHHYFNFLY